MTHDLREFGDIDKNNHEIMTFNITYLDKHFHYPIHLRRFKFTTLQLKTFTLICVKNSNQKILEV